MPLFPVIVNSIARNNDLFLDIPAILPQIPGMDPIAAIDPPAKRKLCPPFTKENAREMQARSVLARKAKEDIAKGLILAKDSNLPEYLAKRLLRVRRQLDRIDDLLLSEDDPAKLDRLAAASMRLAEQERILAGRPLPGSLKPQATRTRRQPQSFGPVEE